MAHPSRCGSNSLPFRACGDSINPPALGSSSNRLDVFSLIRAVSYEAVVVVVVVVFDFVEAVDRAG